MSVQGQVQYVKVRDWSFLLGAHDHELHMGPAQLSDTIIMVRGQITMIHTMIACPWALDLDLDQHMILEQTLAQLMVTTAQLKNNKIVSLSTLNNIQ